MWCCTCFSVFSVTLSVFSDLKCDFFRPHTGVVCNRGCDTNPRAVAADSLRARRRGCSRAPWLWLQGAAGYQQAVALPAGAQGGGEDAVAKALEQCCW